ncbi:MAG: lactate utilization protein [Trueperaceae bacterium]|nr:lactate utilization protein [Trueperaceae bacterium]
MERTAFIQRIQKALHRHGDKPTEVPPALLEPLETWDAEALIEPFTTELEAVGGVVHQVDDIAAARERLKEIMARLEPASYLCSSDPIVDEVLSAVSIPMADNPADADIGISGVIFAIAATGSILLSSEYGRQASLLPMNHVAVVRVSQLVPTLAEAIEARGGHLPSAWVQATGPSRTADIELTLSTGVHGPGVAHVILVRD